MVLEIFPLKNGDFSFLKICSWILNFWKNFNEDLFMEIFPLEYGFGDFSFWRFVRGDFSLKIYSGDWTFEKNFNEDLFMDIFPWRFILRDFSIEVLEIFIEDLFIGDFSFGMWFWRFLLLKMETFFKKKNLWSQSEEDEDGLEMMKIYSWWFFFFEKPILWMRTTLPGSWCGLLDKSLA